MTIPREGQAALQDAATLLASAPRSLGIPDTCRVRSVLVEVDGRWSNHCTVLQAGISDQPPERDLEDFTAGGVRLVGAQFSAAMLGTAQMLQDALTTWGIALPNEIIAALKESHFGPRVVRKPWDLQDTVNINHHASRGPFGTRPWWVIEVYDRVADNKSRGAPRGPFPNFDRGFYGENLGAVVEQWAVDPFVRDRTTVQDSYRIVVPDQRGIIQDVRVEGDHLHVEVAGRAPSLFCAMTAQDERGVQIRRQGPVNEGETIFALPAQCQSVELFVFDGSPVWCDSYFESHDRRQWEKPIVVSAASRETGEGIESGRDMFEGIILEPEHLELLNRLVEAWRNVPRDRRRKFVVSQSDINFEVQH